MNTFDKIKDEALTLFASKGYEGTSLNEIAGKVGIKKPSLYAYFKNKEELYLIILEEIINDYASYFKKIISESEEIEIEKRLFRIFRCFLQYLLEDTRKTAMWKGLVFFPPHFFNVANNPSLTQLEKILQEDLTEIFLKGMCDGKIRKIEIETILRSYYCFIDGYIIQILFYGFSDIGDNMDCMWEIFWRGIKHESEE